MIACKFNYYTVYFELLGMVIFLTYHLDQIIRKIETIWQ